MTPKFPSRSIHKNVIFIHLTSDLYRLYGGKAGLSDGAICIYDIEEGGFKSLVFSRCGLILGACWGQSVVRLGSCAL